MVKLISHSVIADFCKFISILRVLYEVYLDQVREMCNVTLLFADYFFDTNKLKQTEGLVKRQQILCLEPIQTEADVRNLSNLFWVKLSQQNIQASTD